jgi:hypothetical protein
MAADRVDGIDIGHLEEVMRSAGYRLIETRMRAIAEAKLRELRNPKLTHDETQAIRGVLDGIDRCLAVPEQLRAEWQQRKGRR